MPQRPQMSQQVGFGQWTQMDPNQQAAASAGWAADRTNVANYNQAMLEKARQDYLNEQQVGTGIPQGPGVGGAPEGGPAPGVTPPPGGYAADKGFVQPARTGSLGLGLGLNAKNRAGFQAAAQAGQGEQWLAEHPGANKRASAAITNRPDSQQAKNIQSFLHGSEITGAKAGERPYMKNQDQKLKGRR